MEQNNTMDQLQGYIGNIVNKVHDKYAVEIGNLQVEKVKLQLDLEALEARYFALKDQLEKIEEEEKTNDALCDVDLEQN